MRFLEIEPMLGYAISRDIVCLQIYRYPEDKTPMIYPIQKDSSALLIQMIRSGSHCLAIDLLKEYSELLKHLLLTDVAMSITIQSGRTDNPWSRTLKSGMNKIGKEICEINERHQEVRDIYISDSVKKLFENFDEGS